MKTSSEERVARQPDSNCQWTKEALLEAIMRGVPYPSQVTALDLTSEESAIRFTWRQDRFRVSCYSGGVETVEGHLLSGGNMAILMEQVLKIQLIHILTENPKQPGKKVVK